MEAAALIKSTLRMTLIYCDFMSIHGRFAILVDATSMFGA
jgi:hypothetical protein